MKLFSHRRKKEVTGKVPGKPISDMDASYGKEKDGPQEYEGKEHVKYKDPGYSRHEIRIPEDEPHMKSRVSKEESHEMEDNYHMDVPNQTKHTLEAKIKRARMKMDDPKQQEPKPLLGNLVRNVKAGIEDTSGEEEMGPNDMQKETKKKAIVAVMRKKMKS